MRSSRHGARSGQRTTVRKGAWSVVALLAVIALALGAFSLPGALAQGEEHRDKVLETFPHPGDAVKAQIPLLEAVDALDAFLAERNIEGFVGARVDETENKLFIFWHGNLPGEVEHFLSKFEGIHIEVRQVPASLDELEALTVEVMEAVPTLIEGGPDENFTDLRFRWDSEADEHEVDYEGLEHEFEEHYGVEISMSAGHMPVTSDVSRSDDVSPFWGGAVMNTDVATCSTGFAARKQASGEQVMISANHCDVPDPGADWVTQDGGRFIGSVRDDGHRSLGQDTILLTGEDYDSAIYVGDAASKVGAPVVGSSRNVIGALVTSSGGLTGQVDNNRVELVSQFIRIGQDADEDGLPDLIGPTTTSVNLDGIAQFGQGDSGGPQARAVAHPEDRNQFALHAQNLITAGDPATEAECAEGPDAERQCFVRGWGADLPRILQNFELKLP